MKLLVAIDLSESTEIVMKQVEQIAKPLSASVWIIHNAEPEPGVLEFKTDPLEARELLSEKYHQEHQQIQKLAKHLRSKGLNATGLLVHGPTVKTILKEAEQLDVNMIIIGTHGKSAMYQLILGSVSEGILHKSRFPVLVIPTRKPTDSDKSPADIS